MVFSIDKALGDLDWRPQYGVEDGYRHSYEWFAAGGRDRYEFDFSADDAVLDLRSSVSEAAHAGDAVAAPGSRRHGVAQRRPSASRPACSSARARGPRRRRRRAASRACAGRMRVPCTASGRIGAWASMASTERAVLERRQLAARRAGALGEDHHRDVARRAARRHCAIAAGDAVAVAAHERDVAGQPHQPADDGDLEELALPATSSPTAGGR